jgi:hypothetical protein
MFSLKFDLLFPGIDLAKSTARLLNRSFKRRDLPIEPRELKRMQDELRLARDHVRAQVVAGRLFP